ncbi:PAS domain S-box protein [Roseicella aquatilis]|uniref:histidine kinase n=1 Tax=Roseicella aquatilis TaxID=2527868 RepID=A0A4R4D3U2_9PROT|nr:PAS domain S-box protein [Roseicella aquatilis]
MLAVLLPALGLGAAVAWHAVQGQRDAAQGRLRDTAQALALAADRELAGQIGALSAFAASTLLSDPARLDLPAIDAEARRVARRLELPLFLAARDGTRLLSTRQAPDAPLPRISGTEVVERVFATGRPAVSDLVLGSVSRRQVVSVAVPVPDPAGGVALVVGASIDADRLRALLLGQSLPEGAIASMADARHVLVARSDALHGELLGRPIPDANLRHFAGQASGLYRALSIEGTERVFAFHGVPSAPGWTVFVGQPAATLAAAWRGPLLALAAGGGLALALGTVLALLAGRQILHPIDLLDRHARRIAASGGEPGPEGDTAAALAPVPVAELETLRLGFAAAEAALRQRAETERAVAAALATSEARLAESEARLRAATENARVGLVVVGPDHRYRFANRAYARILGLPTDDILGRPMADLLGAIYPEQVQPRLERAFRGERVEVELTRATDGREGHFVITYEPGQTASGEPIVVIVVMEVTERVAATRALAASEGLLRSVIETAADGILVTAADGRIVSANPAALRIFGYEGEEALLGQGLEALMPAAEGARHAGYLAAHRATGQARVIGLPGRSLLGRRRDGAEFPVDISVGSFEVAGDRFFTGVVRDVSQRDAAEAALRESEARLNAVLDALPVGVVIADADGRLLRDNAAHRELWGIQPQAASWEEYGDWAGWWPESGERIAAGDWAMTRALLRGEVVRGELVECARFGSGERRFYLNNAAPVRDAAGGIVGGVVVELDITERRAIEAALGASEARFRALAEAIPSLLWETDAEGGNVYVNTRFADYAGLPAEALLGDGWRQLLHPEDAPRATGAWAAAVREGGPYEVEYRFRRRDGAWRWFLGRGVPVRDGGGRIARWVGTCTDIDDHKRAEAALREGEAQLQLALEAGGMGHWSRDLATGALDWDARQYALFGFDPVQGLPHRAEVQARVHPDDLPRLEAAMAAAAAAGNGAFHHDFRVLHPGGETRWIGAHGHAVAGADGRALRLVGLNMDITEAVAARELLTREAEQLDRLAEERGRALAASEARLAQAARMEALGRLAGGIAHDFNNVLQAMQGGIVLAARRLPDQPTVAQRYLELAAEAAGRGAAVTGRLLSFARRGELRSEPVAPAALVAGLAEMLRPALGAQIRLRVEAPPGLPPLLADKGQLEAVLVNLANNARDAMPAGGAMTLAAALVQVPGAAGAPAGLAAGDYLRLSVRDEGEGMPPAVLARVTEPFFTTKPQGKGTGLGLAMARGFAEQSGGGLAIESEPGRGTTVAVWLPRASGPVLVPGPAAPAAAPLPAAPEGVTVLLAEDKPEVRAVLAAELADHGYAVVEAEDAAAALALIEGGLRPDALVTDLTMPGSRDGLDLLREARTRLPRLPAVLVTGHAGEAGAGRLEEAERGGPFSLLRKPAAPQDLLERLGRVMQRGRLARAAGA